MNGNFKYSLTDEQRVQLRQHMTGRVAKQMVTRAEVREFLQGTLEAACVAQEAPEIPSNAMTPDEAEEIARLRALGKSDGYIIGWMKVRRTTR